MELSKRAKQLHRELVDLPLHEFLDIRYIVKEMYNTRIYLAADNDEARAALREELALCGPEIILMLRSELELDEKILKPHAVEWLHAVLAEISSRWV